MKYWKNIWKKYYKYMTKTEKLNTKLLNKLFQKHCKNYPFYQKYLQNIFEILSGSLDRYKLFKNINLNYSITFSKKKK